MFEKTFFKKTNVTTLIGQTEKEIVIFTMDPREY